MRCCAGAEDNINSRSTRVRQSLTHTTPTSRYEFNFSDRLVFPGIEDVTYSVSLAMLALLSCQFQR